ncbi:nitrilase-related carbon-nitrogen hydrolase [Salinigranum salinum]|uniref:nitrilase-related carbon-nitrogen hydrolase n=1 Tax=Salinigranum salinum TaxID=1364937 RepID=UPI0012609B6E|nr:nitrilase-related carbon-nitrogen hydrolase [Salinigranum salinum]
MQLTLAQLEQKTGDVEGNRGRAAAAVERAADRGADLIALPELWNVGYFSFESYAREAESVEGPTLSALSALAERHDVGLLAGSIVEDLGASAADGVDVPADEGLANTAVFFDREGRRRGIYRKHHLFGYGSAETRLLTAGENLPTVDFEGFTLGFTTCYDLRFPELYRELAEAGVTLVLVPSAWPYPRVEHWKLLPRTRAVENLVYVATINGAAAFDEATLLGRSTVYDPWGTPLASTGDEPSLVTTEVTPERVAAVREEFPAWQDRRR